MPARAARSAPGQPADEVVEHVRGAVEGQRPSLDDDIALVYVRVR